MARRNDHTRDELRIITIQKAKNIVTNEGFHALTARRMAQEIGYTPGTLYNIFGSMDGLILEVNKQTLAAMFEQLSDQSRYKEKTSVKDNLRTMAETYLAFARANPNLWLMVFNHTMADGQPVPEWYRQTITGIFAPLEDMLSPIFMGKNNKEQILCARTLWSAVHGICFMEQTNKTPLVSSESATDMASYLIENFMGGLTNRMKGNG